MTSRTFGLCAAGGKLQPGGLVHGPFCLNASSSNSGATVDLEPCNGAASQIKAGL
jgi:hypothetical protein